jgi:hypothetical protein
MVNKKRFSQRQWKVMKENATTTSGEGDDHFIVGAVF